MSSPSIRVAIIGAGIGGICLAQKLQRSDVSVAVYERGHRFAHMAQGFWIEINHDGMASLQDCLKPGDFASLMANSRPTNRSDCRWLPRGILQEHLLRGLAETVHFDRTFVRYEEKLGAGVAAYFNDGTSTLADVLVGADGAHSNVRKQLLPHARREDTGVFAVGGTAALTAPLLDLLPPAALQYPIAMTGPNHQQIFLAVWRAVPRCEMAGVATIHDDAADRAATDDPISACLPDHVMWRFSALSSAYGPGQAPETMSPAKLKATVLAMVAGWNTNLRRLVELIDPTTIFPLPIRTCVPVDRWGTGRVTLLGDAIHGMAPHGGFGANIAMRDASVLGRNLTAAARREKTLLDAVQQYEMEMLEYGFDAVRRSMEILRSVNRLDPAKSP
jgi:2-polyprenyl-6-methoxyphenol hydroxylase-like FAD-dependent oxidoreductase